MGRKPFAIKALEYLHSKGTDVIAVITADQPSGIFSTALAETAKNLNMPVIQEKTLYKAIENDNYCHNSIELNNVDLVISYLYSRKIKPDLINLPSKGCINFHPAPLPELRGLGGYNVAILEGMPAYGVSAHFVDETFDTGDIIQVKRFQIDPLRETAFSLEQKSQVIMFELFKEVIDTLQSGKELNRIRQGSGRYINRKEFESLRQVNSGDTPEIINRKIRAFWYPPYGGACITIDGKEYTLINDDLLAEIKCYYHYKQ